MLEGMSDGIREKMLDRYESNRVIRGLVQLIPFGVGGAIDVVLTRTLVAIREERTRVFFDELAKGETQFPPTTLESENFLHCFFATTRYALNSRRREKIKMFARLLKSSVNDDGPQDTDEYEEYLEILDELSYRELYALAILDSYSSNPRTANQNDLQWANVFWADFLARLSSELKISRDEVTDFLNRISRSGCYELFSGTYYDYSGGKGKLTPTYRRLKEFIGEIER